jgi:hypothetical protein
MEFASNVLKCSIPHEVAQTMLSHERTLLIAEPDHSQREGRTPCRD